ncbi:MAG: hypothetical protein VYE68_14225, partial [Acidobacteriota bacterium]|nr:hypothetical protein [Acidobacteriota bacterium]
VRPRPPAAVVAVVVTLCAGSLGAQPRHPISVQYDGFGRADDNRLVLSFGYHNLNQVDVTIGVGDENRFLADPADRRQPTVLKTGRHRFACIMVVSEPANSDLRWQLIFAGHTSTTTARVRDPLYALEEGSAQQVMEKLESGSTSNGVCITSQTN